MIQANELRIGNYVNVPRADQSPFKIDLFEYYSMNYGKIGQNTFSLPHPVLGRIEGHPLTWELAEIEPIPLTEEWLLKAGFETTEINKGHGPVNGFMKDIVFFTLEDDNTLWVCPFGYPLKYQTCIYVHQLQNLYFALTGQELTFKKNEQ